MPCLCSQWLCRRERPGTVLKRTKNKGLESMRNRKQPKDLRKAMGKVIRLR